MNPKDTPVTIGMEVESHFPDFEKEKAGYDHIHPKGWRNGRDAYMEFRFHGPSKTIADTFARLDALQEFFKEYGITNFEGSGTHIHLGVGAWLKKKFKLGNGWRKSRQAAAVHTYLVTRSRPIWRLIDDWRKESGWCDPWRPMTPLATIHNAMLRNDWYYDDYGSLESGGITSGRPQIPTIEVRMFPATGKLDAIKGYVALLVSLIKGAEKELDNVDWKALAAVPQETPLNKLPTRAFIANYDKYYLAELRKDVTATGFLVEPLIDWIDRTSKSKTRLVPFHSDLSEIYGNSYQISTPLAAAA